MFSSIDGRSKLPNTNRAQFFETAKLFAPSGCASWQTISMLGDAARRFLREDLRANGRKVSQLSAINDVCAHYDAGPGRAKIASPSDKKAVKFEEIAIPNRTKRWGADIRKLTLFLVPDQETTHIFSKEFDDAAKKVPPFAPFVVPKIRDNPWVVPLQSHERASKYWADAIQHKKSKEGPQQVSHQAWILYMLRFISTGYLSDSWSSFGGISAQFSHLSIVLHLGVTDAAPFAIAYGRELRRTIERLARIRGPDCDSPKRLCAENDEIKCYSNVDLG